jgi:hypothetical protein
MQRSYYSTQNRSRHNKAQPENDGSYDPTVVLGNGHIPANNLFVLIDIRGQPVNQARDDQGSDQHKHHADQAPDQGKNHRPTNIPNGIKHRVPFPKSAILESDSRNSSLPKKQPGRIAL